MRVAGEAVASPVSLLDTATVTSVSSSRLCREISAVSVPLEDIFRIVWFCVSSTYKFVPSFVIPSGAEKVADVPLPSADPELPEPAMVVTSPVEITILRILLLLESAT